MFRAAPLVLLLLAAPAAAQSIPSEGLARYAPYRAELLKRGWKPDIDGMVGTSSYFPEVQCGSKLCAASWKGADRKVSFILWYGPTKPGSSIKTIGNALLLAPPIHPD
jgi:hypothetical protein